MSETLDLKQNISLSFEMQLKDGDTPESLDGYTLACKIKDDQKSLVHEFTYLTDLTWVDQSQGKFKLEVIDVSSWPTGLLQTDVIWTQTSGGFKNGSEVFYIKNQYGVT